MKNLFIKISDFYDRYKNIILSVFIFFILLLFFIPDNLSLVEHGYSGGFGSLLSMNHMLSIASEYGLSKAEILAPRILIITSLIIAIICCAVSFKIKYATLGTLYFSIYFMYNAIILTSLIRRIPSYLAYSAFYIILCLILTIAVILFNISFIVKKKSTTVQHTE